MGGHQAWRKRVARGELAKGAGGAICRHRPRLGRRGADLILNRKGHIAGGNPKKKNKRKPPQQQQQQQDSHDEELLLERDAQQRDILSGAVSAQQNYLAALEGVPRWQIFVIFGMALMAAAVGWLCFFN